MATEWIEVEVEYSETWSRKGTASLDAEEIREWAGIKPTEPIPARKVQEFIEANQWDDGKPWMDGNGQPGSKSDDDYTDDSIDRVRLITQIETLVEHRVWGDIHHLMDPERHPVCLTDAVSSLGTEVKVIASNAKSICSLCRNMADYAQSMVDSGRSPEYIAEKMAAVLGKRVERQIVGTDNLALGPLVDP